MTCRTTRNPHLEGKMKRVRTNMAEFASPEKPSETTHSKPSPDRFKRLRGLYMRSLFWVLVLLLYLWGMSE